MPHACVVDETTENLAQLLEAGMGLDFRTACGYNDGVLGRYVRRLSTQATRPMGQRSRWAMDNLGCDAVRRRLRDYLVRCYP
jgi:hypothetical protein